MSDMTEATMDEADATEMDSQTSLVPVETDLSLRPVMTLTTANERLKELQRFCQSYLQPSSDGGTDGGDYGVIPGAGQKRVLFKSGADKLCDVYGLADTYVIVKEVEDYDRGLFDYTIECRLVSKRSGGLMGTGLGSCSSWESKYRWRAAERKCPTCGASAIIKGKAEFGGGWLCWAKKNGCGAKYLDNDTSIVSQSVARVENPDLADAKNTVLKMAKKRAKVDAVISVTRSSGLFTQDIDDLTEERAGEVVATTHASRAAEKKQATETQQERVARIKEAQRQRAASHATNDTATAEAKSSEPVSAAVDGDGATEKVMVSSLRVRQGPQVQDGETGQMRPKYIAYIINFSGKVKASDGTWSAIAVTENEAVAKQAADFRDANTLALPVISPLKGQKGMYLLERFA